MKESEASKRLAALLVEQAQILKLIRNLIQHSQQLVKYIDESLKRQQQLRQHQSSSEASACNCGCRRQLFTEPPDGPS